MKHLDLGTGAALITTCYTLLGTTLLSLAAALQGEHRRGWAGNR